MNQRPPGYEPDELTRLLYPAIKGGAAGTRQRRDDLQYSRAAIARRGFAPDCPHKRLTSHRPIISISKNNIISALR